MQRMLIKGQILYILIYYIEVNKLKKKKKKVLNCVTFSPCAKHLDPKLVEQNN